MAKLIEILEAVLVALLACPDEYCDGAVSIECQLPAEGEKNEREKV